MYFVLIVCHVPKSYLTPRPFDISTIVQVEEAPTPPQATKPVMAQARNASEPNGGMMDTINIEAKFLQACSESTVTVPQIQSLLQQDPEIIMARTQKGMRPLHICCWKGASVDVVEYLIQQWPESIRACTTREWIPLHVACASECENVQLDVVKCLVNHWKDSVRAKDNKERIPLHICCFSGAPLPVVQYLVDQWPDSVMALNNYASLPLHLACGTRAQLDVIQYLVKCKPESLQAVDNEGRTPLDVAKHPLQHEGEPDVETVAWLEAVYDSMDRKQKQKQGHFDKDRSKLMEVIRGERDKPVAVSSKYVEAILNQQEELGQGHFGVVFMGTDTVIHQKFAIKSIHRNLLIGGTKDDLERVKKEFKQEQKVCVSRRVVIVVDVCGNETHSHSLLLIWHCRPCCAFVATRILHFYSATAFRILNARVSICSMSLRKRVR